MAAEEDDIDIEIVEEKEWMTSQSVVLEESKELTIDPREDWLLYDDQQMFSPSWPTFEDDGMDAESKATIERMLREEQQYYKRKDAPSSKSISKPSSSKLSTTGKSSDKPHIVKGQWTEDEIAEFHQGMEIFGRRWSKIAESMGTRTTQQVKSYAHWYFKKIASISGKQSIKEDDKNSQNSKTTNIHSHLPTSFDTGTPTCKSPKSPLRNVAGAPRGRPRKKPHDLTSNKMKSEVKSSSPKRKRKNSTSNSPEKLSKESKAEGTRQIIGGDLISENVPDDHLNIIEDRGHRPVIVIREREKIVLQDADESDEDIDVDISGDDDGDFDLKINARDVVLEQNKEVEDGESIEKTLCSDENEREGCPDQDDSNDVKLQSDHIPSGCHEMATSTERCKEIEPSDLNTKEELVEEQIGDGNEDASQRSSDDAREDDTVAEHGNVKSVDDENILESMNQGTVSQTLMAQSEQEVMNSSLGHDVNIFDKDVDALSQPKQSEEQVAEAVQSSEKDSSSMQVPLMHQEGVEHNEGIGSKEESLVDQKDGQAKTGIGASESNQGSGLGLQSVGSAGGSVGNDKAEECEPDEPSTLDLEGIIPRATEEKILDRDVILEEEKLTNPEYFRDRSAKTPLKYLAIRNKIIDCWKKCKPSYLTKTAVRPYLKGHGNVNCFSAIHTALEHLGVINFGLENPFPQAKALRSRGINSVPTPGVLRQHLKRSCNASEAKTEMAKLEDSNLGPTKKVEKTTKKRRAAYDPFKLIQCEEFSSKKSAPYQVTISSSALIIMDLHAHLATTEIIGLLGGDYNETSGELEIKDAKPCKSLSTGMQCEMDPVSQTEASEAIMSTGSRVVGWYHSHPTFAPNPSVRDIETQSDFQAWFGPHVPFVGIICSPYLRGIQARRKQSIFNCLTISHEAVDGTDIGKPYKFNFIVKPDLIQNKSALIDTARDLVNQYANYSQRTEMLTWKWPHNPDRPYMEKVITSIKSNLNSTTKAGSEHEKYLNNMLDDVLDSIKSDISSAFSCKRETNQATSQTFVITDERDQTSHQIISKDNIDDPNAGFITDDIEDGSS